MFASEEFHVEHLQDNAMNLVEALCSVIAQPVEQCLRWGFGTQYYAIPITFFAASMMLILPVVVAAFASAAQMIPFLNISRPQGILGLTELAQLYFVVSVVPAVRLGRRILNPASELHSKFEGPPLWFFRLLPKGTKFYFTRIVWEPAFVLLLAIVLQDLYIIQGPLCLYLKFAALALLVKNFISWFRAYAYIRRLLNVRNSAPVINRLVSGDATDEELAPIGLASFPKNLDPKSVRRPSRRLRTAIRRKTRISNPKGAANADNGAAEEVGMDCCSRALSRSLSPEHHRRCAQPDFASGSIGSSRENISGPSRSCATYITCTSRPRVSFREAGRNLGREQRERTGKVRNEACSQAEG